MKLFLSKNQTVHLELSIAEITDLQGAVFSRLCELPPPPRFLCEFHERVKALVNFVLGLTSPPHRQRSSRPKAAPSGTAGTPPPVPDTPVPGSPAA